MRPKILELVWLDCFSDPGEFSIADILKEKKKHHCERNCVGYFVCENDDYVYLAEDFTHPDFGDDKEQRYAGLIAVPKGMILKRRILRKALK